MLLEAKSPMLVWRVSAAELAGERSVGIGGELASDGAEGWREC